MSETEIMHAFYSKIQEDYTLNMKYKKVNTFYKKVRHNIYLHENGHEVVVTEVTNNLETSNHSKNFKDSQYLGKVNKWVRVVYW